MNQELREKFSKEIDELNLEQVTERLSAMDTEVREAKDVDTVKELVKFSNIDKKALPEIETKISDFMMDKKVEMGIVNE